MVIVAHDYRTWQALAGVRNAIKGWRFVKGPELIPFLQQGQAQLDEVEGEFYEEGAKLLQPIIDAIGMEMK